MKSENVGEGALLLVESAVYADVDVDDAAVVAGDDDWVGEVSLQKGERWEMHKDEKEVGADWVLAGEAVAEAVVVVVTETAYFFIKQDWAGV